LAVGLVLAGSIILGYAAMDAVRELVKQIAIWLAVVTLLPLVVWYTTSAFRPAADSKEYAKATARIDEHSAMRDPRRKGELRQRARPPSTKKTKKHSGSIIGHVLGGLPVDCWPSSSHLFSPCKAVGSGLMFGGLTSLAVGC